jgi:hypothetical protein
VKRQAARASTRALAPYLAALGLLFALVLVVARARFRQTGLHMIRTYA